MYKSKIIILITILILIYLKKVSYYYIINKNVFYPLVAKLDIAADSDSEGRGFESLRADHNV